MDPGLAWSSAVSPVAVLASLDDVVWSVSPDGQLVFFVGGAVERQYGLTPHELLDNPIRWLDAAPAEDRERLRVAFARLPDADIFSLEHRIRHAAGGFRWVLTRGKLVRDRDGRPLRVDGITTDITRHAQTRIAIVEVLNGIGTASGSDYLARLAECVSSTFEVRSVLIAEPDPREPHLARAAAAWIGGHRSESFTFPVVSRLSRELLSGERTFVPASARERYPGDHLLLQLRAEALAAEPLFDDRGRLLGCLVVADDLPFRGESDLGAMLKALAPRTAVELGRSQDAQRELAAKVPDAERRAHDVKSLVREAANLAAAGRIAAGLAHDFNNLLGVIAGNADLIRESLPEGDPRRETAELISQTAQSIAVMNRKLLAVGKSGAVHLAPLDVVAALRALEPILRRMTGKRIDLAFDLAPTCHCCPPMRCSSNGRFSISS